MVLRVLIIQAFILVMALALDAFACAFGYGAGKIKIPIKSMLLINFITSFLLAIGLFFGASVGHLLPEASAGWAAFGILFALGFYKLFDSAVKKAIRKHNGINKNVAFSLLNLKFILNIYADPEKADADGSKELSLKEAVPLAVAVGLDGLSVGFGVGIAVTATGAYIIIGLSFISGILAVVLGCYLGNKAASKMSSDLSWLSGVMLIGIALVNVF